MERDSVLIQTVIPANAGVILVRHDFSTQKPCYPRECGGDPGGVGLIKVNFLLSPRMRG